MLGIENTERQLFCVVRADHPWPTRRAYGTGSYGGRMLADTLPVMTMSNDTRLRQRVWPFPRPRLVVF